MIFGLKCTLFHLVEVFLSSRLKPFFRLHSLGRHIFHSLEDELFQRTRYYCRILLYSGYRAKGGRQNQRNFSCFYVGGGRGLISRMSTVFELGSESQSFEWILRQSRNSRKEKIHIINSIKLQLLILAKSINHISHIRFIWLFHLFRIRLLSKINVEFIVFQTLWPSVSIIRLFWISWTLKSQPHEFSIIWSSE